VNRAPACAVVAAFASALAFIPSGESRFVLPKLAIATACVALAAFAAPAGRLTKGASRVLAGGGLVLLVAALAGSTPGAQLLGRWPRYEGLISLALYAGMAWAGARILGPSAPHPTRVLFRRAAATTALILGLFSLVEVFGITPLGLYVARSGTLLGNASDLGLVAVVLLALLTPEVLASHPSPAPPSSTLRKPQPTKREPQPKPSRVTLLDHILGWAGIVAAGFVIVQSQSRGAMLGAVLALGISAAGAARLRGRGRIAWGTLGLAIALTVAVLAIPATRSRLFGEGAAGDSVAARTDMWRSTLRLAASHPILGVGPSGFLDAYPSVMSAEAAANNPSLVLDSPHNLLLQATMAGGLLLLSALLAGAFLLARAAWQTVTSAHDGGRRLDALSWAAALGGCAAGLLFHFTSPGTTPLAALLAGGLLARPLSTGEQPRARGDHRPRPRGADAASKERRQAGGLAAPGARVGGVVAWIVCGILLLGSVAEPAIARGMREVASGSLSDADAAFALAARLRPWDPDVPLIAGTAMSQRVQGGDAQATGYALSWTEKAMGRTPRSLEARRARAIALISAGRSQEALTLLTSTIDDAPCDPMSFLLRGYARADTGDLPGARTDFEVAGQNKTLAPAAKAALERIATK